MFSIPHSAANLPYSSAFLEKKRRISRPLSGNFCNLQGKKMSRHQKGNRLDFCLPGLCRLRSQLAVKGPSFAYCKFCKDNFSVTHGGCNDVSVMSWAKAMKIVTRTCHKSDNGVVRCRACLEFVFKNYFD